MLAHVVDVLACPHCGDGMTLAEHGVRCPSGHTFDVARQGYVSLLPGNRSAAGDTAAMVSARAAFLDAGHFDPIADHLAAVVGGIEPAAGCVVDAGAGTGHYLARVLDRLPHHSGLALDVSKYACRRAAKAHARAGAVVADVWRAIPVRSEAASVVLNVFAPRNAPDMHRILRPGGYLVVVTPNPGHLAELVRALGLLTVEERKQERLDEQLRDRFEVLEQRWCEFAVSLRAKEVESVVAMGPSAWHSDVDALHSRIAALPEPVTATASVTVAVYRRR